MVDTKDIVPLIYAISAKKLFLHIKWAAFFLLIATNSAVKNNIVAVVVSGLFHCKYNCFVCKDTTNNRTKNKYLTQVKLCENSFSLQHYTSHCQHRKAPQRSTDGSKNAAHTFNVSWEIDLWRKFSSNWKSQQYAWCDSTTDQRVKKW